MMDSVSENAESRADLKRTPRRKQALPDITKVDRLPPHSPEAEQGVLGCILLSPNECMGDCIEKFRAGAEVFYDLRHQTIFTALIEMFDTREAIDVITLQQRLKDKQMLDEVGGIRTSPPCPTSSLPLPILVITPRSFRKNISCAK